MRGMKAVFNLSLPVAAVAILAGCASVPQRPEEAALPVGGDFLSVEAELPFNTQWWTQFGDPELTALVDRALSANKSLELASANLRAAEASALGARLGRSYSTSANTTAEVGRAARSGEDVDLSVQGGLGASWEFDAFGRIEAQIAAAEFDVEAARQARRDVAVIVASETARNYVQMRGAQTRLEVARKNAQTQAEGLELLQTLFDNGRATRLDLERAEAQYRTTLASLPRYEATIQSSRNALAALTGRAANDPDASLANLVSTRLDIPEHEGAIATGSLAELVRRRPDIREAEATIGRQLALGEAARADLGWSRPQTRPR